MKKLFLVIIISLIFSVNALCYETNVHQQITKKAISLSNIEQVLTKNLGISLSNKFSDGTNSRPVSEWMELGSKWEDNLPRWLNHFYDPVSGKGLNVNGIEIGKSSLQWGKNFTTNPWNWEKARNSYYYALTSISASSRNSNFAEMFRSIGQVIHLVHDLAVPSHVRNDAHNFPIIKYDMYEIYTRDSTSLTYSGYPVVDKDTFNSFDKFWINNGKGLAEYTNRNYVSRDTNFDDSAYGNYNAPIPIGEGIITESFPVQDENGNVVNLNFEIKYLQGYAQDNYRPELSSPISRLSTFSYFDYETNRLAGKRVYSLNRFTHNNYATLLLPRAVGYSAGLLNYFFRGKMDMIKDPNNSSRYIIKNLSNENMLGAFSLYYDDTNNNRYLAASWGNLAINANSQSSSVTFTAPSSPAPKEKGKYILVFQGTYGNEIGAVMGKVVEGLCAGQWVEIARCGSVWLDLLGNYCLPGSQTIEGKYMYWCSYHFNPPCWFPDDKCIDPGGYCQTRAWCAENTPGDEKCMCNDFSCSSGEWGSITQSPCYLPPSGSCFTSSSTKFEWRCP